MLVSVLSLPPRDVALPRQSEPLRGYKSEFSSLGSSLKVFAYPFLE